MTRSMQAGDRALEAARQLQVAAERTREVLRASDDLLRRSREQTQAVLAARAGGPTIAPDDPGPSQELVACLIQAFELSEEDGDPRTRALLGRVLHHVGYRIAAAVGPKAGGIVLN